MRDAVWIPNGSHRNSKNTQITATSRRCASHAPVCTSDCSVPGVLQGFKITPLHRLKRGLRSSFRSTTLLI